MTTTNLPTQAGDAEVSILGCAMSGYRDVGDLIETVQASDFYSPHHGEIWDAVCRVHSQGQQPDPITVRVALDEMGVKHDPIRLFDMAQLAPVVAQAPYYANLVVAAAGRRRIQEAGTKIHQLGSSSIDLDVAREEARQAIDEATIGRAASEARSLAEVMPTVLDIAQHGRAKALPSGWPDIDRLIGGMAPGRLVVVGARPGVGKSLMGTNLAVHFGHVHKHGVLFVSLEMDAAEVVQRMLARHARVNLTALMDGKTSDADWDKIAVKVAEVDALPVRIIDAAEQTVTSIRREARNFQRNRDDLALIVVDYLQLMKTTGGSRTNRTEALGEVSRGLKLLARETGACVVAMAQVNREGTKHTDGRPRSSDLRESGSIEADADVVILLHQPDDRLPALEVIVDKNRHGPKGIASLEVQGHYAHLASVAWSPTSAIA